MSAEIEPTDLVFMGPVEIRSFLCRAKMWMRNSLLRAHTGATVSTLACRNAIRRVLVFNPRQLLLVSRTRLLEREERKWRRLENRVTFGSSAGPKA